MTRRLKKPREPAPGECCGSGCTRCVWDVYYDALADYEAAKAQQGDDSTKDSDDTSTQSDSSSDEEEEEDGVTDYIGSVVVKLLDTPPSHALNETNENDAIQSIAVLQDFVPVTHIDHVRCSSSTSSNGVTSEVVSTQQRQCDAIHILRLRLAPGSHTFTHAMPGDVVEVFVPNTHTNNTSEEEDIVASLCARLQLQPSQWCELRRSPFVPEDHFPPWLPERQPLTVRRLLTYYVDLSSASYVLRPVFFQSLLRVYEMQHRGGAAETPVKSGDHEARLALLRRCAEPSAAASLFHSLNNNNNVVCYPSLIDVLDAFDFVHLPLARLLELAGPVRARKFSVVRTREVPINSNTSNDAAATVGVVPEIELCVREVYHSVLDDSLDAFSSAQTQSIRVVHEDTTAAELVQLLNRTQRARQQRSNSTTMTSDGFHGHVSYSLCKGCHTTATSHLVHSVTPSRMPPVYFSTRLFRTSDFAQALHNAVHNLTTPNSHALVTNTLCHVPSLAVPILLLVGAGTGIAPLMAAVYALEANITNAASTLHSTENNSVATASPCWVFYGARTQKELVYDDALRAAVDVGTIAHYETALSREGDTIVQARHVTDLLRRHRDAVRAMFSDGRVGKLFACGPAAMLRAVRDLLANDILAEMDDDASAQEQRVRLLEAKEQLCFDVWSTVSLF